MLTKNQFEVLFNIYKQPSITQRDLSQKMDIALGNVNSIVQTLRGDGLISDSSITEKGIKALEPYKVDNAIIMAAGLSSRFAPLSYEKPKGLYKVKGQILIEREIEQLRSVGINDITLVVGYMKEKFFYLESKYGIKIVVNENYYKFNNTSTLVLVKDQLKNTFICSSDNYFTENVFEPYVYDSYYAGEYVEGKTDEYCMEYDKNGKITSAVVGGHDCWFMIGHAYFSKQFSSRFAELLENEYKNSGMSDVKAGLWEDLYISHIDELPMYIRKYQNGVILEFDSLDDLRKFDDTYVDNIDNAIMNNICKVLNCKVHDIHDIVPIKKGLTNISFKFTCLGKKYVYRHPGVGTDQYINRQSEAYSMSIAKELGLDETFIYMDQTAGWKISTFVENCRNLDYHNDHDVDEALSLVRRLHQARELSKWDFNIWGKTISFMHRIQLRSNRMSFPDLDDLNARIKRVYDFTEADHFPKFLCHCDCYSPNFITDGKKMYLIDWEYSGNDDPANDLGTFISCADYTYEEAVGILKRYFGRELTKAELRHYVGYVAIAAYYWFVWAIFQESIGSPVGEYLYLWYKYAKLYGDKALELYEAK